MISNRRQRYRCRHQKTGATSPGNGGVGVLNVTGENVAEVEADPATENEKLPTSPRTGEAIDTSTLQAQANTEAAVVRVKRSRSDDRRAQRSEAGRNLANISANTRLLQNLTGPPTMRKGTRKRRRRASTGVIDLNSRMTAFIFNILSHCENKIIFP